jgi:hypothetical protein
MDTYDPLREMVGDALFDAVTTARTRLSDTSIEVRCTQGLWLIERSGAEVQGGLSEDECLAALAALS